MPEGLKQLMRICSSWYWREARFDSVTVLAPEMLAEDYFEPDDEIDGVIVAHSASPKVKAYFYSEDRVPVAYSDYYRFQIDEDPTSSGRSGQIVVTDIWKQTIDVFSDSLEQFVIHGLNCVEENLKRALHAKRG